MDKIDTIAALFDFDGVVMDTEGQYTIFWNEQGQKYLGIADFGQLIKGQTLTQIYDKHFAALDDIQLQIRKDLSLFEENMSYEFIPGVETFLADLRLHEVKTAVVTSSDGKKMANVYRAHPTLCEKFDRIITADLFTHSKPHPECFLLGMELLGSSVGNTFVFEDSFHGLQAGTASGATVIGLATTNSREKIAGKADFIIDDFTDINFERMIRLRKK